jgi:phasin family protein
MTNQQAQKDTPDPKVENISSTAVKETVGRTADAASRTPREAIRTARDLSGAFASSYGVFADGIQQLQHGYWRIVQKSVDLAASAPAEMMKCRNLTELSELQRDIFQKYLDGVVDANRTLMDVSTRVAENAVRPLQEQIGRA